MSIDYKDLMIEAIEKAFKGIYTETQKRFNNMGFVGELRPGLYRLPFGTLTGEGGWKLYNDELKRQLDELTK
jgi:hypothetical protein